MKRTKGLLLSLLLAVSAAAQTNTPPPVDEAPDTEALDTSKASAGVRQILALKKSGLSDEVIRAYVMNSSLPFGLTAGEIVLLKESGISEELILDIIQRGADLRNAYATARRQAIREYQEARTAQAAPPPEPAPGSSVAQANPVVYNPTYVYPAYPFQTYSYWPVIWWVGRGHGNHGPAPSPTVPAIDRSHFVRGIYNPRTYPSAAALGERFTAKP